ncbi:hypothetical protein ACQP2X_08555 [Actinoplanes sp. CA-131856]
MTLMIAAYAAVVSTASLMVAVAAWRSGGRRLKIYARRVRVGDAGWLCVTADNRSRSDITVDALVLWVGNSTLGLSDQPVAMIDYTVSDGPPLPYRMPAHSSARWMLPPDVFDQALGRRRIRWRDFVRVQISTAFGATSTKVQQPVGDHPVVRWIERINDRVDSRQGNREPL